MSAPVNRHRYDFIAKLLHEREISLETGIVYRNAALLHRFFKSPKGNGISHMPTVAPKEINRFKLANLEIYHRHFTV